jgi:hypothetical protein
LIGADKGELAVEVELLLTTEPFLVSAPAPVREFISEMGYGRAGPPG